MGAIDLQGNWLQYQQIQAYEGYYAARPLKSPPHLFSTGFHDLGAVGSDNLQSFDLDGREIYLIRRRDGQQRRWRACSSTCDDKPQPLTSARIQKNRPKAVFSEVG